MKATNSYISELEAIEASIPLTNSRGRRIAIRSVFGAIEILVSEIANNLVDKLPEADITIHEERHRWFFELCALSNMSYKIDDKGQLRIEQPMTPLRNRALFALNMCARTTGIGIDPRQVEGWNDFLQAVKIRNRVTHPKSEADLKVSSQEYDTAVGALKWFVRCHHRACGGKEY